MEEEEVAPVGLIGIINTIKNRPQVGTYFDVIFFMI
jgi:hypothetical protein